jgi:hypothetical protein
MQAVRAQGNMSAAVLGSERASLFSIREGDRPTARYLDPVTLPARIDRLGSTVFFPVLFSSGHGLLMNDRSHATWNAWPGWHSHATLRDRMEAS